MRKLFAKHIATYVLKHTCYPFDNPFSFGLLAFSLQLTLGYIFAEFFLGNLQQPLSAGFVCGYVTKVGDLLVRAYLQHFFQKVFQLSRTR